MSILKTSALIIFVVLGMVAFSVAGFHFGHKKAIKDIVPQIQRVYEDGIKDGYGIGLEAGKKLSKQPYL